VREQESGRVGERERWKRQESEEESGRAREWESEEENRRVGKQGAE